VHPMGVKHSRKYFFTAIFVFRVQICAGKTFKPLQYDELMISGVCAPLRRGRVIMRIMKAIGTSDLPSIT
jgi:hypothetical protein